MVQATTKESKMSYEGYEEYICLQGHYWSEDAYAYYGRDEEERPKCPHCQSQPCFHHAVDQTNGMIEDEPGTLPAPTEETGFEDDWQQDHYGNKYAVRIPLVKPAEGSTWRKLV